MAEYCIGSRLVPGLSKLIEECGEVTQVSGKIIGFGGIGDHWDGSNLAERLADEMADLEAAILFVKQHNELPDRAARVGRKLALFNEWHRKELTPNKSLALIAAAYTDDLQQKGRIA